MEIQTPQTPHEIPANDPVSSNRRTSNTFVGLFALACVFFAVSLLSYIYFVDTYRNAQNIAEEKALSLVPTPQEVVAKKYPQITQLLGNASLLARSIYVYDTETGQALYARNPDTPLPLASITKVATALSVMEVLSPDTIVTIPRYLAAPSSPEHLNKGEIWTIRDVLTFTLVTSSNDGASYLAETADPYLHAKYPESPATSTTIWAMNMLAKRLGMTSTVFYNPHGLDIDATHAGSYGSARDVAKMFVYAASTSRNLFAGTAEDSLSLTSVDGTHITIHNTDQALGAIPGVIMGKTGLTDLAGGNLAVVFDLGPGTTPIVAVVLGSTESGRFDDMKKILSAIIQSLHTGQ
ncbi:MAG: serine-type D-Ala-D-Ala carboxypeptidase D-alanyl-D-alanine carboxypeptidase [Candidatus Kaiserbacteria bacterium]|nr:serine-type D-Ala-D-Ala carboxypeptidase D-alanyl-D-alanine carboxypeptidase [Candidatus Kaiserbacteria bacterium]